MGEERAALVQRMLTHYGALFALLGVASNEDQHLERLLSALPAADLQTVATALALLTALPEC